MNTHLLKIYTLNFLLINAFFLLSFSCKKKPTDSSTNQNVAGPDNIKYHNITPDIDVKPIVRYRIYMGCNYAPTPLDSATCFYLDVDSDSVNDFKFETKITYFDFVSSFSTSPCDNYCYQTTISSLSPNYFVGSSYAYKTYPPSPYNLMNDSATINNLEVIFSNGLFVKGSFVDASGVNDVSIFTGDKFIAIKKRFPAITTELAMFGWIRVMSMSYHTSEVFVKDFALNHTYNKPIFCGQIK